MKKKLIAIIMAAILCLSSVSVFADTISDKQSDLKKSQNNITELKDRIDKLNESKEGLENDLDKLEGQMKEAQDLLDDVNSQIDTVNASIAQTQKELDKAIEEYNAEQDLYDSRVRAMYMNNGTIGYVQILLSSESFGDFVSRVETVKTVVDYDKTILSEMKVKQEEINVKKANMEEEKSQLSQLQASYNQTVDTLKAATEKKEAYYKSIENNVTELEKTLAAEEKESKALESQIKKLQEQASNNSSNYSPYKTGILRVSDIGYMPRVTSPFGTRFHPVLKVWKTHTGMDLGVPSGTPVYAMAEGKVIISEYSTAYGNYVAINHADGIVSLYAHFSKRLVSVGETVKAGQLIGKSGSTGYSTGPHLHFEIRKNGTPIDPAPYYIVGQ